jgi:hypothetical protein
MSLAGDESAGWRAVPNQPDDFETEGSPIPLLRRWSMPEVLAEPDDFEWLVEGLLCYPTYGQVAGEMKSLKSYLAAMIQVGVASGVPILGQFASRSARPVVAYVGEGGRRPYARRLRRIAAAMGVSLSDIPLYLVTDVLPIDTDGFKMSLQRDLDELKPGLVTLDPLYAYHGARTKASDLHQEGALLSSLSTRCLSGGASLLVVNHMNQTGSGMGLKRITMAGSGEWVDSWLLVAHREPADVEGGDFRLRLEIGSRQWGGTSWDLDLSIGTFDVETGQHDGDICWDLRRASGQPQSAATDKDSDTRLAILSTLSDRPGATKTDIFQVVKGNRDRFQRAFSGLADAGQIIHSEAGRSTDKGGRPGLRWFIAQVSSQAAGTKGWENDRF